MRKIRRPVRSQTQRQRGPKIYSLHAPEVACSIRKAAHSAYLNWRQSRWRLNAHCLEGGAVRRGTARQSDGRGPLAKMHHSGDHAADWCLTGQQAIAVTMHRARLGCGCSPRGDVASHPDDQAGAATAGHRARPSQGRAPHGAATISPHQPVMRSMRYLCSVQPPVAAWPPILVLARSLGRTGSCERFDPDRVRRSRNPIRVLHGRTMNGPRGHLRSALVRNA